MFRALANSTTPTNGVCRLFFVQVCVFNYASNLTLIIQVRNATAAAASKTNAPDTKKPDMVHLKRETQPRTKTFSIYRWVQNSFYFFLID